MMGGSTIEAVFAGMRNEIDLGEHTFWLQWMESFQQTSHHHFALDA